VHLTLANHSVYVTALCFKIDHEADTLHYASGGHPPAFLRAVDGTIERLDSTAFVLGAAAGGDFQPCPRSLRFGPGDALIAYTDGATEARDMQGRYLGVAGIQRVVASGLGDAESWPAALAAAVDSHRHGPIADDTLVIEITRPLGAGLPSGIAAPRSAAAGEVVARA
jgi:sigma-B regulation protein RsbU (phosphoserine phosphatase)